MKSVGRRSLALILSVLMTLSLISSVAFAEGDVTADAQNQEADKQVVQEVQPDAAEAPAPVAEEKTEAEAEKPAAPVEKAFSQSKIVDGVKVAVTADKGVFPADAQLSVTKVAVPAAVDTDDAEKAYAFDITILADGKKIQPDGRANVSFTTAEVARYDTDVYHMAGATAQKMGDSENGNTTSVATTGFSVYAVVFTRSSGTSTTVSLEPGQTTTMLDVFTGLNLAQPSNRAIVSFSPETSDVVTIETTGDSPYDPGNVTLKLKDEPAAAEETITFKICSSSYPGDPEHATEFDVKVQAALSKYTVAFDAGDGTLAEGTENPQLVNADDQSKATEPSVTAPEGQTLIGWFNGENKFDFSTAVTSDLELTAKYGYKVTFDAGDGELAEGTENPQLVVADGQSKATEPSVTPPEGKALAGWFNGEAKFKFNTPITSDLTLVAQYQDPVDEGWDVVYNEDKSEATITRVDPDPELNGKSYKVSLTAEDAYYDVVEGNYKGAKLSITAVEGGEVPADVTSAIGKRRYGGPGDKMNNGTGGVGALKLVDSPAKYYWVAVALPADKDEPDAGQFISTKYNLYHVVVEMNEPEDGFVEDDGLDLATAQVKPANEEATIKYSVDEEEGTYTDSAKNTGIKAGNHALYYQVETADGVVFGPKKAGDFTVAEKPAQEHDFTYSDVVNGEITATCSDEECPYHETPAVLKVVADDMYYAGDTIEPSTAIENDPDGLFTFGTTPTYKKGDTEVESCEDPGYYSVQYAFSCNGSPADSVYKDFTVVEATVEANTDLMQDDGKDLLKTAKVDPEDSTATLLFSLDKDEEDKYSEDIPTTSGITAGDHTVYYKVMSKPATRSASDPKLLKKGSVPVTVAAHEHTWNVEKEGTNVANISCTVEGCTYHDNPITVTLKAEDAVYDGAKKPATIEGEIPEDVQDEITVFWTTDVTTRVTRGSQQWDNEDGPVDAGNYKAYTRVRVNGEKTALTKEYKITPKPVTITGLEAEDKTYDGTTAATINTENAQIEGLVAGDEGKVELDAIAEDAATFEDKDAGEDKPVTLDPTKVTLKGDAAKNYTVDASSIGELTADIDKAPVKVEGITANNKAYDGNTKAELDTTNATFTTLFGEDELTIASIDDGEFEDKNVGTNKKVTIDPTSIVLGGADKDNYEVDATKSQTETTAAITALSVKVNGITASNKEYDGNRNATLVTTGATFEGLVDGDTLTIASIGNGTFSDKNVGEDKTVTIDPSTIVLGGDSDGNYSVNVDESQTETTANITARTLNIGNSIIAAVNKTYDGNTDAELRIRTDGGRPNSQIYRRIAGDNVTVVLAEGAKGSFNNKNVGNNKRVDFTADVLELSGTDKDNYVIGSVGQTSTTANITAKDLTVSGIEAEDKVYDGNRTATLVTDNIVFNGMVEGDDLTLTFNDNAGEFDTRHVGEDKTVTIVWRRYNQNRYTLSGADVGNYNFSRQNSQQTTTASISPAKIKVTAGVGADDKVYDGNVDATLKVVEPVTFDALLNDQDVVSIEVSGTGEFDDKNVGEGKTVTFDPSQITLTGPQAGNYEFDEEGSQSETTASITPKPIKVTGITAKDRYYDGTTNAELLTTGANIEGKVFGDEIFVESASNGKFLDKNAGNGKTVNIDPAGVVLGGTDSDNYSVNPESIQKTTTASIWKLPVEIEWYKEATDTDPAEEPIKYVYNGEKQGPVAKVKNIIEGDKVDVKVIGQEKNASADPYTAEATQLTGDDAGNYTLSSSVKQQYYIDPKPVTVVWTDKTPLVYDGTDKQPDCVVDPSQIVAGDEVEVDDVDVTKDGEKIYWDWDYMVDAATYEFEVTTLDNSNYVLAKDDPSLKHTVVVEQRVAELSWDPTEFIYNGKDRIPEATVTNLVYNVEDRKVDTCNVTAEGAKKDVGDDYTATATELSNKNYKLPDDPTTKFSIKPLEVEIEWSDTEFTYDGKEHMPTATVKNPAEGETLTPVVEAPQTDADTYTATVTGLEPAETAKNYKLPDPLPSTEFTIKEAELTVTAADQTISYGDDFDKTKVSYSGWIKPDDESKLDTPATVTSKYFKNSKPGTYDLVPEGASAKNYKIKTVKGKLTVKNKVTVLIAKGKVLTDSKAKLSWTKLSGAKYYKIYFNKCGKKTKYKYLKTVKRNSLNKGGLLKGQCYKFRVVAYDKNGVKIGKSRNIHFVAGKYNSKLTNAKTIKVNKKKLTLTKGQVYTVKAVQTREIGGKKLLDGNHTALFRFISSNKAVATVSKKGAIKGVGKGWCKIYVKAANGLWTTVEVTVK